MSTEQAFLAALDEQETRTFTLPVLKQTITYTRLDLVESSIKNEIPNFLASRVMDSMKSSLSGRQVSTDVPDAKNEDVTELLQKATEMWEKKVVDPKLSIEQIVRVPSQDRLAWFITAVFGEQELRTEGGGVLTAEEVATFPDEPTNRRNTKRSTNS